MNEMLTRTNCCDVNKIKSIKFFVDCAFMVNSLVPKEAFIDEVAAPDEFVPTLTRFTNEV
jgi:hypothetical protein